MIQKIMYFADFPLSIGGANKVLLTQAGIMRARGYQVLVVIPVTREGFHVPEYDQICRSYGVETIEARYPIATCMEQIEIMDVMDRYDEIRKLIMDQGPDLIHSTQLNITVELAARELDIPHLMNIYQTDLQEFLIDWIDIYPRYHCADSMLFSRRWGQGLGITSRCIRVAYEKRADPAGDAVQKKEGTINVISIGVLCERKNQMEIIKFIGQCKEYGQDARLVLLGAADSPYGESCRRAAEENGLCEDVVFAGFVLDIESYLAQADLLIMASTVESYPGVIVESMANRVPVISTPVAGVPELLRDMENGFLTRGYTAEDIYQAFLRYQESVRQGTIGQIVERAYATYLQEHTYEKAGGRSEAYYQWIVEDHHKRERSPLRIGDIRQLFGSYMQEKGLDRTMSRTMRLLWYLYHIFCTIEKKENKKIAIWGTGMWGSMTLDWVRLLGADLELMGFIEKEGHGAYLGYPVLRNDSEALSICGTILVSTADKKERKGVMSYLDRCGKERNRDYFMILSSPERI